MPLGVEQMPPQMPASGSKKRGRSCRGRMRYLRTIGAWTVSTLAVSSFSDYWLVLSERSGMCATGMCRVCCSGAIK